MWFLLEHILDHENIFNAFLSYLYIKQQSNGYFSHLFTFLQDLINQVSKSWDTYVQNSLRSDAFWNRVVKAGMHCSPKYPMYVRLLQWLAVTKKPCSQILQCSQIQGITFKRPTLSYYLNILVYDSCIIVWKKKMQSYD